MSSEHTLTLPQYLERRKQHFRDYCKAGFTPDLLGVVPPSATLAPGSSVRPEMRGKVPGQRNADGTWNGRGGKWSDEDANVDDCKGWQASDANLGLQTRKYPAVDIDVEDEEQAQAIVNLAIEHLGMAPVRYRKGSPRRLMLYKTAEPLKKQRLAYIDASGKRHAVEILGKGQMFVAEGLHPGGKPYLWEDNFGPCECGHGSLTDIDGEAAEKFSAAVERYVESIGGTIEGKTSVGAGSIRKSLDDPRLHAPTPELAIAALKAIPNDYASHDDIVPLVHAVIASLGPRRGEFKGDVYEWILSYPGNDEAYAEKLVGSINDSENGWNYLAAQARGHGFTDDAQADFDEAPPDAIPETPIERMVKRFVWVSQVERYVDLKSGAFLSGRAFNAENVHVAEFGKAGTNSAEAQFQNCPGARKASIVTYRPGRPALLSDVNSTTGKEVSAVNLWHPPALKTIKGDAGPYLRHVELIFGPEGTPAREHFLDWCAFIVQNPGRKINHAIVLTGAQGVGKDTVIEPLVEVVGRHNVQSIKPEQLSNQFTHFLQAQVVIVEEMSNFTKREVYNRLKDWIAAPPYTVEINKKNQHPYTIPNIQNWVFYSNYEDAIALDEDDRRYWVHRSVLEERLPDDYYKELWTWLTAQNGFALAGGYLAGRDVSQFNPAAPPPMTLAKREMVDAAAPPVVRWLAAQFGEGGIFEGRELIAARELAMLRNDPMSPLPSKMEFRDKHGLQALRMAGYQATATKVKVGGLPTVRLWTSKPPALIDQLGHGKIVERYQGEVQRAEARRKGA